MNYLLDSNVLLYAKMDSMPEHKIVAKWLEKTVSVQSNTINVCETSLLSFLRISTNAKVFQPVLPISEAQEFIESFLACPNVNLVLTSPSHYTEIIKLIDKYNLQGNLVMDAHLAALALSIGATLVTRDNDFAKIPYLKTLNPLQK
ncbi:MAG TPA: PIN domain-containing protein [Pyrinomonadaceae bacterium]|nr:PIN domain-containing protein [Pyrinomonadaceae bacterium]